MSDIAVWVDGAVVDAELPSVRALDHGITVGDGAFETCKIVRGEAFALTRHLARLDRTLTGMGLAASDHSQIRRGIRQILLDRPTIDFGRIRIIVTAGLGPLGSDRLRSEPTIIVAAMAAAPHAPSAAVITVPWVRNERGATAGLKTTSYAENAIAVTRARANGAEEALMANTRDELCEGTASNVFVVVDGILRTPPLSSGCLAGITRELVIEWCREAGLEVREETMPFEVLQDADELIITNSTRDAQAVSAIDGRTLDAPGPVTKEVTQIWQRAEAEKGIDP